jgi:predicted dehydrogenase
MKLLWHGVWMETPGYEVPDDGVLIEVLAAMPLVKLEHASGRQTRNPRRKVAIFLLTDGLRRTVRKARTKHEEPRYTGDFRVTVVLGAVRPSGRRVIALASRSPACAQGLVIHRDLVMDVADSFSADDLQDLGTRLLAHVDLLSRLARQSFLYAGIEPPEELVAVLAEALHANERASIAGSSMVSAVGGWTVRSHGQGQVLQPPRAHTCEAVDTLLRLKSGQATPTMPVAVLGAGDYARTEIIPALRRARLTLYAIADREPQIAAEVGRKFGFEIATTDSERAIAEMPAPGLVVVATAHDSHTQLACSALKAGHRVFLEKPPTVTPEDVQRLAAAMRSYPGCVEIGFNRRYHPLIRTARSRLMRESGPTSISCVVRELTFEADHWYFWPNEGTRITGNICHWIDLAVYLLEGSPLPVSVTLSPQVPGSEAGSDEERVLTVTFEDGSLLTVLGTTRGDDIRGVQEQMDIRRGRVSITIDDLWKLRIRSGGIERYRRTMFRDKAHAAMYRDGLARIAAGKPSGYPVRDMVIVSAIQVTASDLVRTDLSFGKLPDWMGLADPQEDGPGAPLPLGTHPADGFGGFLGR